MGTGLEVALTHDTLMSSFSSSSSFFFFFFFKDENSAPVELSYQCMCEEQIKLKLDNG